MAESKVADTPVTADAQTTTEEPVTTDAPTETPVDAPGKKSSKAKKEEKQAIPYEMELVEITVPFDKDKPDIVISVNMKTFQIKRGQTVKVPRYVKEVYDNSVEMDRIAYERSMKLQEMTALN